MTRERSITHRIADFPWISATEMINGLPHGTTRPIMSFDEPFAPPGYAAWKRRYKRRKAGG